MDAGTFLIAIGALMTAVGIFWRKSFNNQKRLLEELERMQGMEEKELLENNQEQKLLLRAQAWVNETLKKPETLTL